MRGYIIRKDKDGEEDMAKHKHEGIKAIATCKSFLVISIDGSGKSKTTAAINGDKEHLMNLFELLSTTAGYLLNEIRKQEEEEHGEL